MIKIILISMMLIGCNQYNYTVNAGNDNKLMESLYFISVTNYSSTVVNKDSGETGSAGNNSSGAVTNNPAYVPVDPYPFRKEDWYTSYSYGNYDSAEAECASRNMRLPSYSELGELGRYLTWMVQNRRGSSERLYRFFYDGYPTFNLFVRDEYEFYSSFGFVMGYYPASFGMSYPSWGGDRAGAVVCKIVR